MLGQDIIYFMINSQVKILKYIGLVVIIYYLKGFKEVLILLNRMGYCFLYDDVEIVNIVWVREMEVWS